MIKVKVGFDLAARSVTLGVMSDQWGWTIHGTEAGLAALWDGLVSLLTEVKGQPWSLDSERHHASLPWHVWTEARLRAHVSALVGDLVDRRLIWEGPEDLREPKR